MRQLLFGYGSLINLESASRTLKRTLSVNDVTTAMLTGYERSWSLWDNALADSLERAVKGVFLNVMPAADASLNGVVIDVSDDEMGYFLLREKNYDCTDITDRLILDKDIATDFKAFTFVGKKDYLAIAPAAEYYIFSRYIDIVNTGVKAFGDEFANMYDNTTRPAQFPIIPGTYSFIEASQQNSR